MISLAPRQLVAGEVSEAVGAGESAVAVCSGRRGGEKGALFHGPAARARGSSGAGDAHPVSECRDHEH